MQSLTGLLQADPAPLPDDAGRRRIALQLGEALGLTIYANSVSFARGSCFALGRVGVEKRLVAVAEQAERLAGFEGTVGELTLPGGTLHCCIGPASPENARLLRERLPFLRPQVLGLAKSIGCGDRLGLATPGHVDALRRVAEEAHHTMSLVAAQQSVRENARTGRTPQQVLDDAMWGIFEAGWRAGYGADADHLKTPDDVAPWVEAGFTFYTIDPGDHVDDGAELGSAAALREKVAALPWDVLESDPDDLLRRFRAPVDIGTELVTMDEMQILRAAAKYGHAVAHTVTMYRHIRDAMGGRPFELEVSVDETATVTRVEEHIYIATELRRLGVEWVSLAPRYVGSFEKGVDYIGDPGKFRADFARHAAVAKAFGPYKLSLHSGSDKFTVYPIAAEVAGELVHLKTAGTSYLEALRTVAHVEPDLFREILGFAKQRYGTDRASYHVSGEPGRVPDPGRVEAGELPGLIDRFDTRQVLHVTFGSVLQNDGFKERIYDVLRRHEDLHYEMISRHFVRHIRPFVLGAAGSAAGRVDAGV